MFNVMDFDLGLLSDEPCSAIFNEIGQAPISQNVASDKTLEDHMEEDKIGYLEANSDLQAFMDIGSLPEIKDNEEVENVMNGIQDFLKQYDAKDENVLSMEDLSAEDMAAGEELLDELLKSADFDDPLLENNVIEPKITEDNIKKEPSEMIDMTNVTKIITEDGKEIFIMIAPPSPVIVQEPEKVVLAPEAKATLVTTSDDSDWTPDSPKTPKGRPMVKRCAKSKGTRKTPYITDKKERKKQQNVEAARRYRDKKKAEQNVYESEEQVLSDKNKKLKADVAELEAELKTMKKLMIELGIIKPM